MKRKISVTALGVSKAISTSKSDPQPAAPLAITGDPAAAVAAERAAEGSIELADGLPASAEAPPPPADTGSWLPEATPDRST